VSNGYPIVAQMLGQVFTVEAKYHTEEKKGTLSAAILRKLFFETILSDYILKDMQHMSRELLSEEALGTDEMLRDIEEQQYIEMKGNKYTITFPFLKYHIWHPRKDELTFKELNDLWDKCFKSK
jgi:hypothetical protein